MFEVISSHLPLHLLKEVGRFLSREQLGDLRLVCRIWNRFIATRPAHFRQRFAFDEFICYWNEDQIVPFIPFECRWTNVERFEGCCEHLEGLSESMVGQRFFPHLAPGVAVVLRLSMKRHPNRHTLAYSFHNEITEETAFHSLHFLKHIGQDVSFNELSFSSHFLGFDFLHRLHPKMIASISPLNCGSLRLYIPSPPMGDMPPPAAIASVIKSQRLVWTWINGGERPNAAQARHILEQYASSTPTELELGVGYWSSDDEVLEVTREAIKFFSPAAPSNKVILSFGRREPVTLLPFLLTATTPNMKLIGVERTPYKVIGDKVHPATHLHTFQMKGKIGVDVVVRMLECDDMRFGWGYSKQAGPTTFKLLKDITFQRRIEEGIE